jgi:hypothetical protein
VADSQLGNAVATSLLMERSGRRNFVPLARGFLQKRQPGGGAAPLSWFVAAHRHRALQLYLLAHGLASVEPYDVGMPSRVWAAALGLSDSNSARVSISESWSWLERHQLVRTARDGRLRRIWLLDDAGSGAVYTHGSDATAKPDYFKLPHAFWLGGWNERLDLPGTSVLLIALSLRQSFSLPHERGGEWYGISRDTVRRGVAQLREHELLTMRSTWKATASSPTGAAEDRRYSLTGPFAAQQRRARPRAGSGDPVAPGRADPAT